METTHFKTASFYLALFIYLLPTSNVVALGEINAKLKRKTASNHIVHPYMIPLVGDLDGDSIAEIIMGGSYEGIHSSEYHTKHFYIFKGNNLSDPKRIEASYGLSSYATAPYAIGRGRLPNDTKDTTLIFVSGMDDSLRAYNNQGLLVWVSKIEGDISGSASVSLADINNDGNPEIIVLNGIFSFDGQCLIPCSSKRLTGNSTLFNGDISLNQAIVCNMDDDPDLEYVAGNVVYDVTISNLNGMRGNTMIPIVSLSKFFDGRTAVADIDNDGDIDVIVNSSEPHILYIWDGQTPQLIGQIKRHKSESSTMLIGDVNSDGYPEIVSCTKESSGNAEVPYLISSWQYDPRKKHLFEKWRFAHNDPSASTAMTFFDFNSDGLLELCYRDNEFLRIINPSLKSHLTGEDTSVYDLCRIPCGSATTFEYPVIANVDHEPGAEIIVAGDPGVKNKGEGAALMVFGSIAHTQWADARPVWNQYAYNSVNVNNDLTIPSYPISPSIDTFNHQGQEIRHYNSFLMQHEIKRSYVDLSIDECELIKEKDSVLFRLVISNNGSQSYQSVDSSLILKRKGEDPFWTSTFKKVIEAGVSMRSYQFRLPTELFKENADAFTLIVNPLEKYPHDNFIGLELIDINPMIRLGFETLSSTPKLRDEQCDIPDLFTIERYLGLDVEQNEVNIHIVSNVNQHLSIEYNPSSSVAALYSAYIIENEMWVSDEIDLREGNDYVLKIIRDKSLYPLVEGKLEVILTTLFSVDTVSILFSNDFDKDGFTNSEERGPCLSYTHGVLNEWYHNDPQFDDDLDGVPNIVEAGNDWAMLYAKDTDFDGIPDFLDEESKNNGIPDCVAKFCLEDEYKGNQIYVRKAISPNGDGLGSEQLYIENINKYPNNEVVIFNKMGEVIYHEKGYDNYSHVFPGGLKSDRPISSGTYFYSVQYYDPLDDQNKLVSNFFVIKK